MNFVRDTSSPLSSIPSSQPSFHTTSSQPESPYRQARKLPFELLNYVKFYLEEPMFGTALRMLTSLATTNPSSHDGKVFLPPPGYLSTISTIAIHPNLTTRTLERDKHSHAISALRYLETLTKVCGPVNADLAAAFHFHKYDTQVSQSSIDDDSDRHNHALNSIYATSDSLYTTAEDFWSVVGFALSCSSHPTASAHFSRWQYYERWLTYHISVLEEDWSSHAVRSTIHQSLLWEYISTAPGGNARARRILRAVFADASPAAAKEFRPIFDKELKQPKTEAEKAAKRERAQEHVKREQEVKEQAWGAVNIDEEIYGDYLDSSSSGSDDEETANAFQIEPDTSTARAAKRRRLRAPNRRPKKYLTTTTNGEDSDTSALSQAPQETTLGPPSSIALRLRLLHLLLNVSTQSTSLPASSRANHLGSEPSFPSPQDLYTLFVEFIRPLPLPLFAHFVLPSTHTDIYLNTASHTTLCEFLLQRLNETNASSGVTRNPFELLTQSRLVEEYLPFAAGRNTVEHQAKLSLLCESLLRRLRLAHGLTGALSLQRAAESGIEKRRVKAEEVMESKGKRGTRKEDEEEAWRVLQGSARRIEQVVGGLKSP